MSIQLQTKVYDRPCLNGCGETLSSDFKVGGAVYCFCPSCQQWSVHNPTEITQRMVKIEEQKYGFYRGAGEE